MEMISVNDHDLFDYLRERKLPVMEIELIRLFTGGFPRDGEEALFQVHFSLYHSLYRLKEEAGSSGYYLHLDPMRVRMLRIPDEGCRHYLPEEGCFCREAVFDSLYCAGHAGGHGGEVYPFFDPVREFYLNPDNISFGNSHILKRLMRGIRVYGFRKGEIDDALDIFGLTRPNRRALQKRYHELARRFHPDSGNGNMIQMKRLNHAYNILKEVFVI